MEDSVNQFEIEDQKSQNQLSIKIDKNPSWIRVKFNGLTIADSKDVLILHERGKLPVYYFPEKDVRTDVLFSSDQTSRCPLKGNASYWTIKVGDRVSENAVWSYQNPLPKNREIKGYYAFYWQKVDAWFEEEEEIFVHPRDPYKRVDAIQSSRSIKIVLDGITLAESRRPVIVFETGVPVRYYLPKEDVDKEILEPSDLKTQCPYKGIASYWNVIVNGKKYDDLVWSYVNPIPEIPKIARLLAFYNERVEIYVDGDLEKEPSWYYSALDYFNASEIS